MFWIGERLGFRVHCCLWGLRLRVLGDLFNYCVFQLFGVLALIIQLLNNLIKY